MKKIKLWGIMMFTAMVMPVLTACGGDSENSSTINNNNIGNSSNVSYDESDPNVGRIQTSGAVDLGLSVKWGSCNIGASSPYDFGGYFAWGETAEKPYSSYGWGSYIYSYNSTSNMLKYCNEDNKYRLDLSDDVAHIVLGNTWRIPSGEEMNELITKCEAKHTTYKGVAGYLFVAPNGNRIFLPQAGHCWSRRDYMGRYGDYWTANRSERDYLGLTLRNNVLREDYRYNGMSIRPVKE